MTRGFTAVIGLLFPCFANDQYSEQFLIGKNMSFFKSNQSSLKHFNLLALLCLALSACSEPASNEKPLIEVTDSSALLTIQQRLEALSKDVDNSEAVANIKRLQWAYGHYSELGLWHDFADLFSEKAIGHYPAGDLNRDQIRSLFVDQVGQGQLGLSEGGLYPHISFTPVVNLSEDGQSAKARFRIIAMLGGYGGNATWAHGVYENGYVKEDGIWKVSELGYHGQVSGSYGESLSTTLSTPLTQASVPFHYYPEQIGKPHSTSSKRNGLKDLNTLKTDFLELEQRLEHLNAEKEVSNLQHAYGYYMDRKQWDSVASLFAENANMELGQQGVYVGKESIRSSLEQFGPSGLQAGELRDELQFQTYVTISPDGKRAKARVTQLGMWGSNDSEAQWREGIYENEYVKENGAWKIQSLHHYPRLKTAYAQGWAKQASPAAEPNIDYPADLPPTEEYEIYPSFYIPAFHFSHPVTQQPPQYPEGSAAQNALIGFADNNTPISTVINTSAELEERILSAEIQIAKNNAYDATENLISAFSFYLDERMWTAAAQLFAEDGSNEIPTLGASIGSELIQQALLAAYGSEGRHNQDLSLHHILQPVIQVADDGQSAQVSARLWQINVDAGEEDYYLAGIYQGRTVLEGNTWKIQKMNLNYTWTASYLEGWSRRINDEH